MSRAGDDAREGKVSRRLYVLRSSPRGGQQEWSGARGYGECGGGVSRVPQHSEVLAARPNP
jgi:hypothetical protein